MPQRPEPSMSKTKLSLLSLLSVLWMFFNTSCNNSKRYSGQDIASSPKELQQKTSLHIENMIHFAKNNKGKIDDSTTLIYFKPLEAVYEKSQNAAMWSKGEQ